MMRYKLNETQNDYVWQSRAAVAPKHRIVKYRKRWHGKKMSRMEMFRVVPYVSIRNAISKLRLSPTTKWANEFP